MNGNIGPISKMEMGNSHTPPLPRFWAHFETYNLIVPAQRLPFFLANTASYMTGPVSQTSRISRPA